MYFNVIAGIIILLGSFFGLFGKQLQDKSSSDKSDKILKSSESTGEKVVELKVLNAELTKKSDELNDKAEKQAQIIDRLRTENTELYFKLTEANKEIYSNLTGGDSYCKMQIGNLSETGDFGNLIFMIEGKYPLSRVQARVVDLNNFSPQIISIQDLEKNVIEIGTLEPDKVFIVQSPIRLDKERGVNLNVFFGANNGFTTQQIRMKFIKDKWIMAERITRQKDNKEIYKKVDPGYSIEGDGKIFK